MAIETNQTWKVSDISGLCGSSAQTTTAAASVNKRKLLEHILESSVVLVNYN